MPAVDGLEEVMQRRRSAERTAERGRSRAATANDERWRELGEVPIESTRNARKHVATRLGDLPTGRPNYEQRNRRK